MAGSEICKVVLRQDGGEGSVIDVPCPSFLLDIVGFVDFTKTKSHELLETCPEISEVEWHHTSGAPNDGNLVVSWSRRSLGMHGYGEDALWIPSMAVA